MSVRIFFSLLREGEREREYTLVQPWPMIVKGPISVNTRSRIMVIRSIVETEALHAT